VPAGRVRFHKPEGFSVLLVLSTAHSDLDGRALTRRDYQVEPNFEIVAGNDSWEFNAA